MEIKLLGVQQELGSLRRASLPGSGAAEPAQLAAPEPGAVSGQGSQPVAESPQLRISELVQKVENAVTHPCVRYRKARALVDSSLPRRCCGCW